MLLFSTKTNNNFLFENIKEEEKTLRKCPLLCANKLTNSNCFQDFFCILKPYIRVE